MQARSQLGWDVIPPRRKSRWCGIDFALIRGATMTKRIMHRLTTRLTDRVNNETLYRAACSCGWEGGGLHELEEFAEHEGIVVHLPTVPMDLIRR